MIPMSETWGERGPVRRLAGFVGAAIAMLATCAALVWPIWFLATSNRGVFTLLVAIAVVAIVGTMATRRFLARRRRSRRLARREERS